MRVRSLASVLLVSVSLLSGCSRPDPVACPLTTCGSECVDTTVDPSHCGGCGNVCGSGQICDGTCLASEEIYGETFIENTTAAGQCTRFNDFRAALTGDFRRILFFGSRDPVGIACTDPAAVATLAANLSAGSTSGIVNCDGRPWQVCDRGDHQEFWVGTSISCDGGNCPASGYMLRPCGFMTLGFWGGINTGIGDCSPPTQSIFLFFER